MAVPPVPSPPGADPSMDEILASIRKILNEDEAKAVVQEAQSSAPANPAPPSVFQPGHQPAPPPADDVLVLDETMMVPVEAPLPDTPVPSVIPSPPARPVMVEQPSEPAAAPALPMPAAGPPPSVVDPPAPAYTPIPSSSAAYDPTPALVGPAAAGAASASVEALVRTLTRERTTVTHRGGPTIEDLVREEVRPLLKDWLDTHLPPLVERLVRTEIERLVTRTTS